MEWTREKRYLPYDKWSAEQLLRLQAQAATSPYQMHYHLRPVSGLINDPNGFSYFNGAYHLFYQSYPFGSVHGLKCWWHFKSTDLVHWHNLGIAIQPDSMADSHGAYSGSARQIKDKLFIMYTGNHRDENWVRTPYQIGAWMDKNGHLLSKKILFKNPAHITEHFRDPQILPKEKGYYYALLGAQDKRTKSGHIDVWRSEDLQHWLELGFLPLSKHRLGYMIECPSLVKVAQKNVFIFCPQGLDKKVAAYQNIYPNMYVTADKVNLDQHKAIGLSSLHQIDDGFDVYATEAFNAPNGKAYAISWVGLPDTTYPTDSENWANCLSQVKELSLRHGHLRQQPVSAIKSLRFNKQEVQQRALVTPAASSQYEFKLTIKKNQRGVLSLAANKDLSKGLKLSFDTKKGNLTLDRSLTAPVSVKYGTKRSLSLPEHKKLQLDIFVDHSLLEIFINHGDHVMTARFFTDPADQRIAFAKNLAYHGKLWQMQATN